MKGHVSSPDARTKPKRIYSNTSEGVRTDTNPGIKSILTSVIGLTFFNNLRSVSQGYDERQAMNRLFCQFILICCILGQVRSRSTDQRQLRTSPASCRGDIPRLAGQKFRLEGKGTLLKIKQDGDSFSCVIKEVSKSGKDSNKDKRDLETVRCSQEEFLALAKKCKKLENNTEKQKGVGDVHGTTANNTTQKG